MTAVLCGFWQVLAGLFGWSVRSVRVALLSRTASSRSLAFMRLLLASSSPRRKELLQRIGIALDICPADIDESVHPGEAPLEYVTRLAASKASTVARARSSTGLASTDSPVWILGADTIVEIDGRILGKASNEAEAHAMLECLVGRTHRVTTAFALRGPGKACADRVVTTEVVMRPASATEIADYVASGEWRDKAGAYAVQGMAAALVIAIRGSITNVIGLPLAEVVVELDRLGAATPRYREGMPE